MEQEFDVEIKEVLSRVQKVKAESLDDAINKAMDMYYAEQIVHVTLRVRKTQKLPMVFVVLPASAFIIPAMAAMPQAAVTNWKSMMTNSCVK